MKIQCDYCGNTYEDTQKNCPSCGAPNPSHQNSGKPKSIEELQAWYTARHLPAPEVTRFFIGVDYKKPKAFGIYKDENGDFVVYKNKANGSRAIRYKGKDEQYAVNELYQRLKDEIVHQKAAGSGFGSSSSSGSRSSKKKKHPFDAFMDFLVRGFFVFIVLAVLWQAIATPILGKHNGYYKKENVTYYDYQGSWYYWDSDTSDWYEISKHDPEIQEIVTDYDSYYVTKEWNSSVSAGNWDNSSFYESYHSSDDSDSDYDWGGGDSWDSDSTDWDSDW